MYKIFADDILIYDDTSSDPYYKVTSPTLTLELGAAGSLKMTIPPGNAGYETIERMSTTIRVEKDGGTIWEGRVLQEDGDFWNQRILFCEGALAYLNDSVQEQMTMQVVGGSVESVMGSLIGKHNYFASDNRKFDGFVLVDNAIQRKIGELNFTTDYETTIEAIQKYLISQYGGYLNVRYQNGIRHLEYLENPAVEGTIQNRNSQVIEFGKNLMDFTKSFDASEFATVLLPLGKKNEKQEGDTGPDTYTTVASVDHDTDSDFIQSRDKDIYVHNVNTESAYGRIEKVIHFDDVEDPLELFTKAKMYLLGLQFNKMRIRLSAFDLHYLNPDIEGVKLGDLIRVKSTPHGLDTILPIQKLDIPLDRPQDTAFELAGEITVGFTSASNQINEELFMQINQALDRDAILEAASAHVNAIMSQILNGFITLETETDDSGNIHSDALYISDAQPLKNPDGTYNASRFWKWSMTGLGFATVLADGTLDWKTAMTMDGTILGERIAAASIHGTQISADAFTLVTSAGQSALTMRVAPRVLAPDAFEVGNIDDTNGKNINGTTYARTKGKIRLESGWGFHVTGYTYELFLYSDDNDSESGFVCFYASPTADVYSIPVTGYYRIVLRKTDTTAISNADLAAMPKAVAVGGNSSVISAADLKIIGMVTFESLGTGGTDSSGHATVIDGGHIISHTIDADKLNVYGLTVKRKQNGQVTDDVTFAISENGDVTIDAVVQLSENSVITFNQGNPTTLGTVIGEIDGANASATAAAASASQAETSAQNAATSANNAETAANTANTNATAASGKAKQAAILAAMIANGTYTGAEIDGVTYNATFIDGKKIISPLIYANVFTAITTNTTNPNQSSQTNPIGGFVLERPVSGSPNVEAFKIYYWYGNEGWEAHFAAENRMVFEKPVTFFKSITFGLNDPVGGPQSELLTYGKIKMYGSNAEINLGSGRLVADYQGKSWGPSTNRPSSPVVGQLYFQTD